jgi:flagellar hook-length control protein FliK
VPTGAVAADNGRMKAPSSPDVTVDVPPPDQAASTGNPVDHPADPTESTDSTVTLPETPERPASSAKPAPSDLHSTAHAETVPSAAATETTNDAAPAPAAGEHTETGHAWEQVARAVRSVRRDEDGNHTMTVRLDPPELGTIELEVQIRDGRLHLHAGSDSTATRELLARAMPELRAALDADGIATGSLDVGARAGGQGATGHAGPGGDATGDRHAGSSRPGHGGTGTNGGVVTHSPDQPGDAPASARLDLRL